MGSAWGKALVAFPDISDMPFEKTGLLGVCVELDWGLMTASAWGLGFAWGLDLFAWGWSFSRGLPGEVIFRALVCSGTSISTPLLLGDLLGVDVFGAVRQGCPIQARL